MDEYLHTAPLRALHVSRAINKLGGNRATARRLSERTGLTYPDARIAAWKRSGYLPLAECLLLEEFTGGSFKASKVRRKLAAELAEMARADADAIA